VRGSGVEEHEERGATKRDVDLHGLTGADAGNHVERDVRRVRRGLLEVGGVVVVVPSRQVKEEDALAHVVVAAPKLLVAVEAEAKSTMFLHLRLGESFD
jgi:hypothetical protein